jgi:hypothetical protein
MRLGIFLTACMSLATTPLSDGAEFSQVRDLPPLKMGATDLDAVLVNGHSLVEVANGSGESSRQMVKVSIDGQEIEIPHLSLASSLAFPNEVFGFSYMFNQADKPISSLTIDLGDSLRRISVSGESADKVEEISKVLEKDFRRYSVAAGGLKFRRVTGICLSILFLSSFMIGAAYCWNTRNYMALGIPACAAIGFLLLLLIPWKRFLPGFVIYQRYSPFFLVRHAPEICVLAVMATLVGIPLSYFLAQRRGNA